jgi:hypothetical protein
MEVSSQFHAPAALPPGKTALGIHCIGGGIGTRAGLDVVEKRMLLLGIESRLLGRPVGSLVVQKGICHTSAHNVLEHPDRRRI